MHPDDKKNYSHLTDEELEQRRGWLPSHYPLILCPECGSGCCNCGLGPCCENVAYGLGKCTC